MTWSRSSAVRWLGSGTYLSDTLTLPAGGSSVCSHTFRTTNSAPCSAASAAAQVNALRLPGDPSTPTTMVFHSLTVVSSPGADDRRRSDRIAPVGRRTGRRRRGSRHGARHLCDVGSSRTLLHGVRPRRESTLASQDACGTVLA